MSGIPPADLARLRELVTRGDPTAIEAMKHWERWQRTPRENQVARRHARRVFERFAHRALNDDGRPEAAV